MDDNERNSKLNKLIDQFLKIVIKDKNVQAVFLFGSIVNNENWDKSDVDIAIIFKNGTLKDNYLSYSSCIDMIDFEVVTFNYNFFIEKLSNNRTMLFYKNMINNGKLLYCKDEDIENLFINNTKLSKRDQNIFLLKSGTYAILSKLKLEKYIYYTKDLRLALDYLNRYIYNLSCIEVISNNEIYGREPEKQAMNLNPKVFKNIIDSLYSEKLTIDIIKNAYIICNEYLKAKVKIIFNPIISWLDEEQREIGISEISGYIEKKYNVDNDLFQITNACNYLVAEDYLTRSSILRPINKNSKIYVNEQAYMIK